MKKSLFTMALVAAGAVIYLLSKDKEAKMEYELMEKIKDSLVAGHPVRKMQLTDEEKKLIKPFQFITAKPII